MKDKILNALRSAIKSYRKSQGEITLSGEIVINPPHRSERIILDDNDVDEFMVYIYNTFHAEKPKLRGLIVDAFQSIDNEKGQSKSITLKFEINREDYSFKQTVNGEYEFVIQNMALSIDNSYLFR